MGADDADALDGDCPHWWLLVSAVLDGRGAWRVLRCVFCDAETVVAASADRL